MLQTRARLSFFMIASCLATIAQNVPSTLNYQGRLTDNSPSPVPLNSTVNMTFEIWDVPVGGTPGVDRLWVEPASGATPVVVTGGIFSVLLGASAGGGSVPIPASLFFGGTTRYLQLIVNGETLTPRQTISATGYANQAQNAALAANATSAATATNATQLGGVAAASWQRSLSVASCPAGQFYNAVSQAGAAGCATVQSTLAPPLTLSGSSASPIISGINGGGGHGLYGENSGNTGSVFGVHGRITSTTPGGFSTGVRGENLGTGGNGIGIWGSQAGNGYGVLGTAVGGRGVYGAVSGSAGFGGYFSNSAGGTGVFSGGLLDVVSSTNNAVANTARFTPSGLTGTHYDSYIHYGTTGDWYIRSGLGTGKTILQDTGGEVWIGSATSTYAPTALVVQSQYPNGIISTANQIFGTAIMGQALAGGGTSGTGVAGSSYDGGIGIYGNCSGGAGCYAGYFVGNTRVNGTLSKTAGSFIIDHPLDPANKYLSHSFVESPDMMNIYNGNIVTDANGEATVTLPDWFEALNKEFRYQLTVIGEFAQAIIAREIGKGSFTLRTSKPGVKVSWQVTGIRKDAYAEKHRIPVEQDKPENQRGRYLHPEDYGQPEEKGVDWRSDPDSIRLRKQASDKAQADPASAAEPAAHP